MSKDHRRAGGQQLEPGTTLAGSYQLVRELARGGMGAVWEARHLRLSSAVAVKVLHAAVDATSEAYQRFRREAEIASQLGHPHIIKALDFDSLDDGSPFLVMELLRGESLRSRISRGALDLEQTVALTGQIASALHAAHRAGIVHRDLKPENVFLCDVAGQHMPHAMLLDFGISKLLTANTALTEEGMVFGTPQYMAPEQAGADETGSETDQYALAAIVYEMLCGQPAFGAGAPLQVLFRVVNDQPPPLEKRLPSLAKGISKVVARAMAKAPAQRFGEVLDFARELERAAGGAVAGGAGDGVGPTEPPHALRAAAIAPTESDPQRMPVGSFAATEEAVTPTTAPVKRPPSRRWIVVLTGIALLLALGWVGRAMLSERSRSPKSAPPRKPPSQAVDACKSKASDSPCSFRLDGRALQGRCWSPEPDLPLACKPDPPQN